MSSIDSETYDLTHLEGDGENVPSTSSIVSGDASTDCYDAMNRKGKNIVSFPFNIGYFQWITVILVLLLVFITLFGVLLFVLFLLFYRNENETLTSDESKIMYLNHLKYRRPFSTPKYSRVLIIDSIKSTPIIDNSEKNTNPISAHSKKKKKIHFYNVKRHEYIFTSQHKIGLVGVGLPEEKKEAREERDSEKEEQRGVVDNEDGDNRRVYEFTAICQCYVPESLKIDDKGNQVSRSVWNNRMVRAIIDVCEEELDPEHMYDKMHYYYFELSDLCDEKCDEYGENYCGMERIDRKRVSKEKLEEKRRKEEEGEEDGPWMALDLTEIAPSHPEIRNEKDPEKDPNFDEEGNLIWKEEWKLTPEEQARVDRRRKEKEKREEEKKGIEKEQWGYKKREKCLRLHKENLDYNM